VELLSGRKATRREDLVHEVRECLTPELYACRGGVIAEGDVDATRGGAVGEGVAFGSREADSLRGKRGDPMMLDRASPKRTY
jgi:hypothetical protein